MIPPFDSEGEGNPMSETLEPVSVSAVYRALLPMTDGLLSSLDEDDVAELAQRLVAALQLPRAS